MRIGELAQKAGVDSETIRYYEKVGLLLPPPRSANGYRDYGKSHIERLAFVRYCRELDMSLADVKGLLDFVAHPEANCGGVNRLIDEQLRCVRERLNSLLELERHLNALRAHCCQIQTARECGILHELVATAQDEAGSYEPAPVSQ